MNILTDVHFMSEQTVCGISIDYYRQAGPRAGVSWCVRVRAEILCAIGANQCLPPYVNHLNFQGRFMPNVRVACNIIHGDDFASVIGPQFDRLVKHYAKRWVVVNGIVLEDRSVANGFWFNQELVERCFNSVGAIERWLRDDMGKLDWWEKVARVSGLETLGFPSDPGLSQTPSTSTRPAVVSPIIAAETIPGGESPTTAAATTDYDPHGGSDRCTSGG
ncbi:uncharacterized protein LY79DRAFT_663755 [Colletotrichum navitas]|uniref:Uncharacterized protein n=1 Tax=Colletotrichum navitas TaxID=681940 RepID=A0AAD8PKD1_9PEZI|nr:uncharacterized protein LY79DRAFT_663755 [Colletotrichum navitas]KAK1566398.1 hypothetical protein LY79DRAFT_663755 [Colletotrichum navitas]